MDWLALASVLVCTERVLYDDGIMLRHKCWIFSSLFWILLVKFFDCNIWANWWDWRLINLLSFALYYAFENWPTHHPFWRSNNDCNRNRCSSNCCSWWTDILLGIQQTALSIWWWVPKRRWCLRLSTWYVRRKRIRYLLEFWRFQQFLLTFVAVQLFSRKILMAFWQFENLPQVCLLVSNDVKFREMPIFWGKELIGRLVVRQVLCIHPKTDFMQLSKQ